MNATPVTESPNAAPQSLALDARAVAMLKAMGVHWRWPEAESAPRAPDPAATAAPAPSPVVTENAAAHDATAAAPEVKATEVSAPDISAPAVTAPGRSESVRQATPVVATPPRAAAAPLRLEGLGWDALQRAPAQCQACGLATGRTGHSWGHGAASARWLFITERVHPQASGQDLLSPDEQALLNSLWRAMGVPASEVFVTALTKCRGATGQRASAEDTQTCLAHLQAQAHILQADLVVALGLPVAHALWGASDTPLAQWRGQLHDWQGHTALVTYPLDALLRRPVDKAKLWADLCLGLDHVATLEQR